MIIAHTLLQMKETRNIYLYDTFSGMSEPTGKDYRLADIDSPARAIWKNKLDGGSLSAVRENIYGTGYPQHNLIFVEGKVEDTIPVTIPEKIALLRLDTDWYESTKHELTHLFPRISKNGVLIVDDYGAWNGAKNAVDEYLRDKTILMNRVDRDAIIGVKNG